MGWIAGGLNQPFHRLPPITKWTGFQWFDAHKSETGRKLADVQFITAVTNKSWRMNTNSRYYSAFETDSLLHQSVNEPFFFLFFCWQVVTDAKPDIQFCCIHNGQNRPSLWSRWRPTYRKGTEPVEECTAVEHIPLLPATGTSSV